MLRKNRKKASKDAASTLVVIILITFLNPFAEVFSQNEDLNIEANLVDILEEIYNNQLGSALEKTDELVTRFPKFTLGHLIKGDLLQAQFQLLNSPGSNFVPEKISTNLIEEAIVRSKRFHQTKFQGQIPEFLIKIPKQFKHVLVLDASRSTLYVFRNEPDQFIEVGNFYATIGKRGTGKLKEGDKKTPIGVYRVTKKIKSSELSNFYGAGAFPINYPNQWDKLQGYNGYGIWLHGSPWNVYSRPPQASDGCIVLNNDDFVQLGKYIDPRGTPVILTKKINWTNPDDNRKMKEIILNRLFQWKEDWESLNTIEYLKNYSKAFTDGKSNIKTWSKKKLAINSQKTWIKVQIGDVAITPYPGQKNMVAVSFSQSYRSNNLNDQMTKLQFWSKKDGDWKIIFEGKN